MQCRAGVHARRGALRRPGRVLARPRCGTPPPSLTRCHLPLQERLLGRQPIDSLPCKGLRSRAPPAAEKARRSRCSGRRAQACFSARKGALPLCFAGILQSPAEPYPASVGDALRAKSRHFVPVAFRNAACGRQCSHRPANPAMPQTPSGGRSRPPGGLTLQVSCKHSGRALPRIRRGRCLHRPANPAMPPPGPRLFRPPAIGRTPKL